MANRRLGNLPPPEDVASTIVDVIMLAPQLPGDIIRNVGSAISQTGSEMSAAAGRNMGELPDPVELVTNGLDYVVAIPKGAVNVVGGVFEGVRGALVSAQGRLRSLSR